MTTKKKTTDASKPKPRKSRKKMGDSFIEYLTKKRMERAKQYLRETDLRSGEIALAVGYKDPRYFSYVFKRTQGCTPSEYRAREAV